jgi:hypothetical protein
MVIDRISYWISKVCYKDNHIHSVKIYRDSDLAYGLEETWTEEMVVDKINKGYNISTIMNNNGRWIAGARVKVVNIGVISYIQTDKDTSAEDNLENLPKFG